MTLKNDLEKLGMISFGLLFILCGMVVLGQGNALRAALDPEVEAACFDEIKKRAPWGYRAIITYGYREESSRFGIVNGGLEAQYGPDQWTQVNWSCHISPKDLEIAHVELSQSTGKGRIKAAATAFQ